MTKVVDLKSFSAARAIEKGQKAWKAHFPEKLTAETRLADLSDETILALAQLGSKINKLLYEVIIRTLDFGGAYEFENLPSEHKIQVLDTSLFLIDQIRWECLNRLNWIHGFAGEVYPIAILILDRAKIQAEFQPEFPELNEGHPQYFEFKRRRTQDGEALLRSMIPAALAGFSQRL